MKRNGKRTHQNSNFLMQPPQMVASAFFVLAVCAEFSLSLFAKDVAFSFFRIRIA